jgi:site-specific recombinase XerD
MLRVYKKGIDISTLLDLHIDETDWNNESQLTKSSTVINEKLLALKLDVFKAFNEGLVQGEVFSKEWLNRVINNSFNRPSNEIGLVAKDYFVYLSDFGKWWIKEKSATWKTDSKNVMSKEVVSQYENFLELMTDFEAENGKLLMKDLKIEDFYSFIEYLEADGYNNSTISRQIGRLRFFCNRAVEENLKISNAFKQRIYIDKDSDEIDGVSLNELEIEKIFNLDLSHDSDLDNVRDNLIISLWSGLRLSDFMFNLKIDNIKDGFISIKTQKTKAFVKIPVHNHIQKVLSKRFGNLPKKFSATEYNRRLKTVCQLAEIDNLVYGKLWNAETKRKELKYAPKYQFCSSHLGRKSLCTNLSGKVQKELIQKVFGWTTVGMVDYYNATTKNDYANKLMEVWSKQELIKS